jgi:hypothetical protein
MTTILLIKLVFVLILVYMTIRVGAFVLFIALSLIFRRQLTKMDKEMMKESK